MLSSKYVPHVAEKPWGSFVNRPSIEYTGRGDQLVCFAWNCRYFRSSWDDVKAQGQRVVAMANGTNDDDGSPVNINTFQDAWGITCDDSGERFGWSPSEDWPFPCLTYDICGKGTMLYDQFKEDVLLVSIPTEASPYECYWEV